MKIKRRSLIALLVALVAAGGTLPGCGQADNPTPEKAAPPPPPKAEELVVPKKGSGGTPYGGGARYKKAMENLHK